MADHEILRQHMDTFFVWTKKGRPPKFAHSTLENAQAEADRLAVLNPGGKFIVMQAVSKHSVPQPPAELDRVAGEASAPATQVRAA